MCVADGDEFAVYSAHFIIATALNATVVRGELTGLNRFIVVHMNNFTGHRYQNQTCNGAYKEVGGAGGREPAPPLTEPEMEKGYKVSP